MSQEDEKQEDKKVSEKVKEKAAWIGQHLKDHKTTYLVGAGCLAVGSAVGLYFRRPIVIDFKPVIDIKNMPTFNNTNLVENNLGGHLSKIVRDVATGEEWQKIRYLAEKIAEEHQIPLSSARTMLSKHLQGNSDHVFGKVYEIVGLRTDFMN